MLRSGNAGSKSVDSMAGMQSFIESENKPCELNEEKVGI